jgi:hypothetical protein
MSGARTRRMRRIAASREFGDLVARLRANGAECDSDWMRRHESREDGRLWLTAPVSHANKASDTLSDCNYEVAGELLREASGFARWTVYDAAWRFAGTDVKVPRGGYRHRTGGIAERSDAWPGGLIETILVRADDAAALRVLASIITSLADYPSLDDARLAEMEHEEAHPSGHECYGSDDCGCEVRNHGHAPGDPDTDAENTDEDGGIWCERCCDWVPVNTTVTLGVLSGQEES